MSEEILVTELTQQQVVQMHTEYAVRELTSAVQTLLDTTASTRGYDGILSACTYATSTNPVFAAEAQACVEWRDACWTHCYQVMNNVQTGLRAIPTVAELLSELPAISW